MEKNLTETLDSNMEFADADSLRRYAKPHNRDDWGLEAKLKCNSNDDTMVTVVCITYNHEDFIADALESFLLQETDFKFKVFVGDDCSTDRTPEIVKVYAEEFPDIIVPFCREENLGGLGKRNLIDLCNRATSPYIAFCEGDDYWVDRKKLQKQFDFMEAHDECRVCTARTLISAPEDWHLRTWYKELPDGTIVIPDSIPSYSDRDEFTPAQIIGMNVAHTSTHFYRWNYDMEIPEWYFEGMIGDTSLLLLQLGMSNLHVLKDVTSCYRINEGSVFFDEDRDSSFLHTRLHYVRYLNDMREYAYETFPGYPVVALENRLKLESANYLRTALKMGDIDLIVNYFKEFPDAAALSLNAYLSFYSDQRSLSAQYGWDGYRIIARNRLYRKYQTVPLNLAKQIKRHSPRKTLKVVKKKKNELEEYRYYWKYADVPKDNAVWVFSGFRKCAYMDNTKYFFEYVVEHHPEIQAYWTTSDEELYESLREKGLPVLMNGTPECTEIVSRAAIAVTDHFRMSDYSSKFGFNANTKIVQLWHGVGFKTLGDGETIKNSDVPGVCYSDDILPQVDDSPETVVRKKLLFHQLAPNRELFERYFMLICPGQERIDMLGKPLHVQESAFFFAGHPRNIDLYSQQPSEEYFTVLYAPTYRFNSYHEKKLIFDLLNKLDEIESLMNEIGGRFDFRLHPHTWRNYESAIRHRIKDYSRIELNSDPDIYQSLGTYHVVISDYSSIAMDFAMLHRPTIFYCPDYDWFVENESGFNIDFDNAIPGPKTDTWEATFDEIKRYRDDPDWDRNARDEKLSYFFKEDANGPDNSERIIQEIKRRLGL